MRYLQNIRIFLIEFLLRKSFDVVLTFGIKFFLKKLTFFMNRVLLRIFLYSDWTRTRNNSVFGHISRRVP